MKRFFKKGLSVILAVSIIFGSAAVGLCEVDFAGIKFENPFAVKTKAASESDLNFTLNDDGVSYSVTDCNTYASGSLTIPSTYNGKPVKCIGYYAFENCTSLTSVIIPDSVTEIGTHAFSGCASLNAVTIGNSVTNINDDAFVNCTSLTSIELPDSVTYIGSGAFGNCTSLASVTMPNNVIYVAAAAFENCESLCAVYITDIENWCKSNFEVGANPLRYAQNLCLNGELVTELVVPDGVTSIGGGCFDYYSKLTEVTIPNSVESIGSWAFCGCTNLTSITIPDSVTNIGEGAFCGCTNLTSITIPDGITNIASNAFFSTGYYNNPSNWDNNVFYVGNYLIKADTSLSNKYTVKAGTTSIVNNAFSGCTGLTSIIIPDSVTSIGYYAFYGCTSLTTIDIGDGIISIGDGAFYKTIYYKDSNNWENGALYIGDYLIATNSSLADNYIIKDGTKCIADAAFSWNNSLKSVEFPDSLISIGGHVFMWCTNLTSITIPNKVTRIGDGAFSQCSKLSSVILPDSVTSIGEDAFGGCTSLLSIAIPNSVTKIRKYSFSGCKSLTSIEIPDGVTSIGYQAFEGCENLTSIEIPGNVTSIGHRAFRECSKLASVVISDSVTIIGESAFSGCFNLSKVICNGCQFDFSTKEIGQYNEDLINADWYFTPHSSGQWIIDSGATCTEAGLKHKECTACKTILETLTISATGHTEVEDNAVAATCTTVGKTEGKHCSVCNTVLVAQQTVPAKGHTAVKDAAIAAKCTTAGKTEGSHCSVCNAVIVAQQIVPAKGHTSSNWIIDKAATCTEAGSKHVECTVCKTVLETVTIVATGHTEVADAPISATCTAVGKTSGIHCSVCNAVIVVQQTIPAKGHTYSDWIIDKAASCTEVGLKYKECTECEAVLKTEVISAKGHTLSDWILHANPTCIKMGMKYKRCEECYNIIEMVDIPMIDHIPTTKYNEETRTEYEECTMCKVVLESKYIPMATTAITSCYNEVKGVQLKWNAVEDAAKYEIYRKLSTESEWTMLTTVTTLAYQDTAVTGNTVYQYAIKAVDQYGNQSDYSAQRECRFIATPKLLSRANAIGGVTITWEKVAGATSYRIYRRGAGTDYWYYLGDVDASKNTFFDKESSLVSSGNYYRYTVRASYSGKDSAGKNYLIYSGFDTNGLYLKYVATPKLTSISNATNGLQIKWNAVAGVTNGYRVYRRGAGSTYWTYLGTVKTTSYTDTQVKNSSGNYYRYTVIADGGYHSAFDTTGLYLKRLANPTLKSATSAKAGITVKWGAVSGTTGYYVYRKTANSGWTKIATVSGTNTTSYLDKTAKKGTTYTYTVRAVYGSTTSYFNSGISCKDKY